MKVNCTNFLLSSMYGKQAYLITDGEKYYVESSKEDAESRAKEIGFTKTSSNENLILEKKELIQEEGEDENVIDLKNSLSFNKSNDLCKVVFGKFKKVVDIDNPKLNFKENSFSAIFNDGSQVQFIKQVTDGKTEVFAKVFKKGNKVNLYLSYK